MDSLDELDYALFGKNFENKNPKASTTTETKKKVMFKDFKANPLEELSDDNGNDDEDFDESPNEKSLDVIKDNKIADLFGLRDKKEETNESPITQTPSFPNKGPQDQPRASGLKESDVLGEPVTPPQAETPGPAVLPKMKSLFDDNDDVISSLVDRPKPPYGDSSKKSMLMEDLFGKRSKPIAAVDSSLKKSSLNFDAPADRPSTGEALAALGNDGANKAPVGGFSLSAPKEPRRGRRSSAVQNDPLGLLSSSSLQLDEPLRMSEFLTDGKENTRADNTADLPEWLGGPKAIPRGDKPDELDKTRSDSAKSLDSMKKSITDLTSTIPAESAEQSALASKLLGLEFDQQAVLMNMQQQEHELRTAAVLGQQSDKLGQLLEAQKARLAGQEQQFSALISRQLERQTVLEAQMRAQQERIDNYIKALAAQPTVLPAMHLAIERKSSAKEGDEEAEEKIESESLLQKLRLEKLYLENTLDSLREKHEKEISILDDSCKKQVTFLEEAMVQMEKRMQDDVESIEADYKLKIQRLKEELAECNKAHLEEKDILKQENSRLIQEIRDHHSRSLEVLQKEHLETIERITRSKESERQAIEIMRTEGTSVQNVLNKSQVIIENLEELQKRFEGRDTGFAASQTAHLSIQEKNIEYLKEVLEKQKNDFVEEKQRLMDTIRHLEANVDELTREFKAQSVNFKEGEMILKSKEQALLRDREIFAEQTTWERERLQAMRDAWSKEQDLQLEWLTQERQALAAEKGKLQVVNRMKIGVDESSKVELEAMIRAAQDAAASASQEKFRWQEKINELEAQRKALQDKEIHLVEKAKELQEFTQSAINKRDEGLRALKEARFIEERYKDKLNQLQLQQEILTQRESKLASEKLELARERLAFRVGENLPVKDTTGSTVANINHSKDHSSHTDASDRERYSPYMQDIVDPKLVLLKWELSNKSEFSLPVTSI